MVDSILVVVVMFGDGVLRIGLELDRFIGRDDYLNEYIHQWKNAFEIAQKLIVAKVDLGPWPVRIELNHPHNLKLTFRIGRHDLQYTQI
jgi:hypothetical protein